MHQRLAYLWGGVWRRGEHLHARGESSAISMSAMMSNGPAGVSMRLRLQGEYRSLPPWTS